MAKITAAQFGKRYGAMCRAEYPDLNSGALLTALGARQPPIVVSRGILEQWMKRSIKPPDAITVSSTKELEEKYGAVVKLLAAEHVTAYKLCATHSDSTSILLGRYCQRVDQEVRQ